jgi:hypothetical protein
MLVTTFIACLSLLSIASSAASTPIPLTTSSTPGIPPMIADTWEDIKYFAAGFLGGYDLVDPRERVIKDGDVRFWQISGTTADGQHTYRALIPTDDDLVLWILLFDEV